MLTNSEIKDIIKVIRSLENTGILLIGTTRKMISQEGRFFNFLRPLMTFSLPLMKNVLTPLGKSVLVPLGLTAAASATEAVIKKKIFGPGTTALLISNDEINYIMKIVNEHSGLLIKGVSKTINNK